MTSRKDVPSYGGRTTSKRKKEVRWPLFAIKKEKKVLINKKTCFFFIMVAWFNVWYERKEKKSLGKRFLCFY